MAQPKTSGSTLQPQEKHPIKALLAGSGAQEKIKELVGKNAATFTTSVLQIVNSNSMLSNATPMSVFNAACMAATLNLPINNALGFAFIVPYKKDGEVVAQFQLGYKGFIQLAQRTGQFKRLVSVPVYEGQIISKNPITGYEFDWDVEPEIDKEGNTVAPIGYYAYFQLLNGFTADVYMSDKEIRAHASRYSQTFKKGYGIWHDHFEVMAMKTVMKLLLSKQAPLSIDIQKSLEADQAVIKDVSNSDFSYPDNEVIDHIAATPSPTTLTDETASTDAQMSALAQNVTAADLAKAEAIQHVDKQTGEVLYNTGPLSEPDQYPVNPDDDDIFAGTGV